MRQLFGDLCKSISKVLLHTHMLEFYWKLARYFRKTSTVRALLINGNDDNDDDGGGGGSRCGTRSSYNPLNSNKMSFLIKLINDIIINNNNDDMVIINKYKKTHNNRNDLKSNFGIR
jgi:hypothetical protein